MAQRNPKLSVREQVELMKSHGIRFTVMNEEQAAAYMETDTYYFKLKAYAVLFDKDSGGKYRDLEFAYLKDLAIIDSVLRKKLLQMSLDIEHYLKVLLLRDFNRSDEDGYEIVSDFLSGDPGRYDEELKSKESGRACSRLVQKYRGNFALWNIIEVISFSDFQDLYQFFYRRNGKKLYPNEKQKQPGPYAELMTPVRLLRNTAAHNNCLLNNLRQPFFDADMLERDREVGAFLERHGMDARLLRIALRNPLLHDYSALLYLFYRLAPPDAQRRTFRSLQATFSGRVCKHAEYYNGKNALLTSAYEYAVSLIDIFCRLAG